MRTVYQVIYGFSLKNLADGKTANGRLDSVLHIRHIYAKSSSCLAIDGYVEIRLACIAL